MVPLESQVLEYEPILGDGQASIARETMAKSLQGHLLKCLWQQLKHNIRLRAAAQEQSTAAGASPLPHSVPCQSRPCH